MNLTPLWGYEEPPEMEWVVDQFLPKGYPTILAADGGIGKSFLSLHLATCVALGRPFLGLPVMRGNVLYLDFELQAVDQQRRLMKVLRGLGLDQHSPEITDRLFHLSPSSSLSDDHLHDKIGEVVRFYEIDLIVLDSLSFSLGGDASDQETVINAFRKMSSWNTTTLCVDHIAASARLHTVIDKPFGSIFKRNYARVVFSLTLKKDGTRLLQCGKNNFGSLGESICYEQLHPNDGKVLFRRVGMKGEMKTDRFAQLSTHDITLLAIKTLEENGTETIGLKQIVRWRKNKNKFIELSTIGNHITKLKENGSIRVIEDGNYRLVPDRPLRFSVE